MANDEAARVAAVLRLAAESLPSARGHVQRALEDLARIAAAAERARRRASELDGELIVARSEAEKARATAWETGYAAGWCDRGAIERGEVPCTRR